MQSLDNDFKPFPIYTVCISGITHTHENIRFALFEANREHTHHFDWPFGLQRYVLLQTNYCRIIREKKRINREMRKKSDCKEKIEMFLVKHHFNYTLLINFIFKYGISKRRASLMSKHKEIYSKKWIKSSHDVKMECVCVCVCYFGF